MSDQNQIIWTNIKVIQKMSDVQRLFQALRLTISYICTPATHM